jgi:hypothetical protein
MSTETLTATACPEAAAMKAAARDWTWQRFLRHNLGRYVITFGLFNLENLLRLLQPYTLGLAITAALAGMSSGLWLFLLPYFMYLGITTARRMFDTRAFTRIYADLAADMVTGQRQRNIDISQVAARSYLARELVEFFERDFAVILTTIYSVLGTLVVLSLYDPLVALGAAVLVLVPGVLHLWQGPQLRQWQRQVNNQLEQEVGVIIRGQADEVQRHYDLLRRLRVYLSDRAALHCGILEVFVCSLLLIVLARCCRQPETGVGQIFAVFRYVWIFAAGLTNIPVTLQQVQRLRDIGSRLLHNSHR